MELDTLHNKYWTLVLFNMQIILLQNFLSRLDREFSTTPIIRGRQINMQKRQLTAVIPKGFSND